MDGQVLMHIDWTSASAYMCASENMAKIWNEVISNHKTISIKRYHFWIRCTHTHFICSRSARFCCCCFFLLKFHSAVWLKWNECHNWESTFSQLRAGCFDYAGCICVLMHTEWMCILFFSTSLFSLFFLIYIYIFVNFNCWHFFYSYLRLFNFSLFIYFFYHSFLL